MPNIGGRSIPKETKKFVLNYTLTYAMK